jgi:hypothetical protein
MERGASIWWVKYVQQVDPRQKLHLFSGVSFTSPAGFIGITVVIASRSCKERVIIGMRGF